MPKSLVDKFKIDKKLFRRAGALDPILGVDTRLFIDPLLLRDTSVPELKNSYETVIAHFAGVLRLVKRIKHEGDALWKAADARLTFNEVSGLCIGYSSTDDGRGMGVELRRRLLGTVTQIVQAGVEDPEVFELAGIFQDRIGPDLISDMIAKIIIKDLIKYTRRVCDECDIPVKKALIKQHDSPQKLPFNPYSKEPLILVPKELLRDLPVAETFGDIDWAVRHNQKLRDELNQLIGGSWKKITTSDRKAILRGWFTKHPGTLSKVIGKYKKAKSVEYDFEEDPAGEVVWYEASKKVTQDSPLLLSLSKKPTADEVEDVVLKICEHFRKVVEKNQLAHLLYDKGGKPKHEAAAQKLFYGIASSYCEGNDLDLTPEADAGRGPVDFKVSSGFKAKVLVEVKLAGNHQLTNGFKNQLPIYQDAEGTLRGFYLVIDTGGCTAKRGRAFRQMVRNAPKPAPRLIWVDGALRESASKATKR